MGVDAVDVGRFRAALDRTPSMRTRLFTDEEIALAAERGNDAATLAARFAVREATMKALGVGLGAFDFHDVWVRRAASGAPELMVSGRAAQLATDRGVNGWHLSLSHTDSIAIAVVVAL
ncbi:MAG: holo-ACP synthase [Ilumatobacteraceae bacterium]|nr:holo-ACP synthase [Ilumatobacteraceae bacterium]